MALRVLLADESSTIKKVIQLALQDYAVEVRAVNVGIDVLPVARQFKPDIVFADVLLQKRSGYDVSSDIKGDPQMEATPVVLMWSGFMELDEDKFQVSRAEAQLEKPFDVGTLRKLVQKLVPKTKNQDLSKFLKFPTAPAMEVAPPPPPRATPAAVGRAQELAGPSPGLQELDNSIAASSWDMESFEPIEKFTAPEESFRELNLPKPPPEPDELEIDEGQNLITDAPEDEGDGKWVQTQLSRFQVRVPQDDIDRDDGDELPVNYVVPEEKIDAEEILAPPPLTRRTPPRTASTTQPAIDLNPPAEEPELDIELDDMEPTEEQTGFTATRPPLPPQGSSLPQMSPERLEELIRAQSRDVIESVVWKIVPDLAKQIIERELKRLLDEKDSSLG